MLQNPKNKRKECRTPEYRIISLDVTIDLFVGSGTDVHADCLLYFLPQGKLRIFKEKTRTQKMEKSITVTVKTAMGGGG